MPSYTQDIINQRIKALEECFAAPSSDEADVHTLLGVAEDLAILNGVDPLKKQQLMRQYDFYELKRHYQKLKNILPKFVALLERKRDEQLFYIEKRRPGFWRKIIESAFRLVNRQRKVQLSEKLIQILEEQIRAVKHFIDPHGINPFALQRAEHALQSSINLFCDTLAERMTENLNITTEKRTLFKGRIGELGSTLGVLHHHAAATERKYGSVVRKYLQLVSHYNTYNQDCPIISDKPWVLQTADPEYKKEPVFYLL